MSPTVSPSSPLLSSPSQHISIIRRHVAQLGLLILGQTDVVGLVPAPVLEDAGDKVQDTADGAQADEGDADAVALVEEGLCVGRREAVTGDDAVRPTMLALVRRFWKRAQR